MAESVQVPVVAGVMEAMAELARVAHGACVVFVQDEPPQPDDTQYAVSVVDAAAVTVLKAAQGLADAGGGAAVLDAAANLVRLAKHLNGAVITLAANPGSSLALDALDASAPELHTIMLGLQSQLAKLQADNEALRSELTASYEAKLASMEATLATERSSMTSQLESLLAEKAQLQENHARQMASLEATLHAVQNQLCTLASASISPSPSPSPSPSVLRARYAAPNTPASPAAVDSPLAPLKGIGVVRRQTSLPPPPAAPLQTTSPPADMEISMAVAHDDENVDSTNTLAGHAYDSDLRSDIEALIQAQLYTHEHLASLQTQLDSIAAPAPFPPASGRQHVFAPAPLPALDPADSPVVPAFLRQHPHTSVHHNELDMELSLAEATAAMDLASPPRHRQASPDSASPLASPILSDSVVDGHASTAETMPVDATAADHDSIAGLLRRMNDRLDAIEQRAALRSPPGRYTSHTLAAARSSILGKATPSPMAHRTAVLPPQGPSASDLRFRWDRRRARLAAGSSARTSRSSRATLHAAPLTPISKYAHLLDAETPPLRRSIRPGEPLSWDELDHHHSHAHSHYRPPPRRPTASPAPVALDMAALASLTATPTHY
ncbi:uncharacterized protein AMSG_00605 [Thecamonas trahens ATCC 50062]|uniref:Uncharacterized protein n=1 Tax=Thecamonas trahens ATCC 50062 TaxID=461836 RepID=A0A0L0DE50_THETB|nr:hypothetical protein AMSG_00605 [Thecamonas trahens ATCC 50062]KNC50446.1 hypothetical protein AMSG_00605 [Thecamonas trahens ATCC 50062]|eukprot:XP_013762342.1 hypothetical protein AMSG_00605 [Thecamonas trahens ATCC 50062]